jgi:poly-beta-1,6-N-acetyl-D-glucosamine synthase
VFGQHVGFFGPGLAWGVAISVVATLQLIVALALRHPYDQWGGGAMLIAPLYPLLFWLVSASAAVNQQITALIRGPRERRVVWDIPREPLDSTSP